MPTCDFLIIGAGIIGLSTAYHLQKQSPKAKIVVIEKENDVAEHQSARNSGVVHAGVYYPPNSLKAKFCKQGVTDTKAFCETHQLPFKQIGKLIVAHHESELKPLQALYERAKQNGIEVSMLDAKQAQSLEPNIQSLAAIYSPTTAITDYQQIAQRLAICVTKHGGIIETSTPFVSAIEHSDYVAVKTPNTTWQAGKVISCAGLYADRIAKAFQAPIDFQIIPFRGEFYEILNQPEDFVRHLIYPVPDPKRPFLGVHITPKISGRFTVGPNAVLAGSREGYRLGDIKGGDLLASLSYSGFWKMLGKNLRPALNELSSSLSKRKYLSRVTAYCPSIGYDDLRPYPAGVRAQAVDTAGQLIEDFQFSETPLSLHVCNAPSPAATAFSPIGEYITQRVLRC